MKPSAANDEGQRTNDKRPAIRIIPPAMPETPAPHYPRVLLKISGEGFCHEGGFGIEAGELENIAQQCVDVCKTGVQLAVVVGGGPTGVEMAGSIAELAQDWSSPHASR